MMQRKRQLPDNAPAASAYNPFLFNIDPKDRLKSSMQIRKLKHAIAHCLSEEVNDFVNAVLLCEEIFNKTRPIIEFGEDTLGAISPLSQAYVDLEFPRLITAYSSQEPDRLDYVEHARLANDIIHALLRSKKYLTVCALIDSNCIFAISQVTSYIRNCELRSEATHGAYGKPELLALRNLFEEKSLAYFQCQTRMSCAFAYYYLHVKCQLALNEENTLNIKKPAYTIQELAYNSLLRAEEIRDDITSEINFVQFERDDEDDALRRNNVYDLIRQKNTRCFPLIYTSIKLGNPIGCMQLVSSLDLCDTTKDFWFKLGLLQGNIFNASSCLENLAAPLLERMLANYPRHAEVIDEWQIFYDFTTQEFLRTLDASGCDKLQHDYLLTMFTIAKDSRKQRAELIKQIRIADTKCLEKENQFPSTSRRLT